MRMSDSPDQIELDFIRILSTNGNQIGKSPTRLERRERIRQALYVSRRQGERFTDSGMTMREAFEACYGERLDRRSCARPDEAEMKGEAHE